MAKKVNELSDLTIDEVSFVDKGANQHAKVLIHKRNDVGKGDPDPSSVSTGSEDDLYEEEQEEDDDVDKGFFSRLVSKMRGSESSTTNHNHANMGSVELSKEGQQMPQLQGQPVPHGDEIPPEMMMSPEGMIPDEEQLELPPEIPEEVIDYIQELETALAQYEGEEPTGEENADMEFGKHDNDDIGFLQELAKNLEAEDQRHAVNKAMDLVSKANDRAKAAEEIAKAERDFRVVQEYVAKARAFTSLPVSPEEFGPVLKRMSESLSESDYGAVVKALSAANETLASSGFFSEIGKRGSGSYEAVSKVDAAAFEIRKSHPELTLEQARERAMETNPSLYDEYLQQAGR